MVVPRELEKLVLYAADEKLCAQWPDVYLHWRETYPQLDIMAQVKAAHEWEYIRPPCLRKRNRKRFLGTWLARAFYRLPPAVRCQSPSTGERDAMIQRIKKWRFVWLNGCRWEVRTHGLELVSGHAPCGTRVWNSMACWELREVERADVNDGGVQGSAKEETAIPPQPEGGSDGRRDFF